MMACDALEWLITLIWECIEGKWDVAETGVGRVWKGGVGKEGVTGLGPNSTGLVEGGGEDV